MPLRLLLAILLAVGLLIGAVSMLSDRQSGTLVLAAASLQESLEAAADDWEAQGNPRPTLSFAGTSSLARQIEAGAPADLFISADEKWMDELEGKGLIQPPSRVSFLENRLVLIAPAASEVELALEPGLALAAALGEGRLAMADPDAVPAGRYAKEALTALGAWDGLAGKIARAENVRAALALVNRGEAPLGIVYETDAVAEAGVRMVGRFPAGSHVPISYPLARVSGSDNPEAEAFRRYLLSPEASAIFQRFGFATPEPN